VLSFGRSVYTEVVFRIPASNNGMHPTANSELLIVSLGGFGVECEADDAGRWTASFCVEGDKLT
jgi:hypothetical protein